MNRLAIFLALFSGAAGVAVLHGISFAPRPSELDKTFRARANNFLSYSDKVFQVCASILGTSVALVVTPLHSYTASILLGSALGWAVSGAALSSYKKSAAKKLSRGFEFALASFIEQLLLKVVNGSSIHSGLISLGDADNTEIAYFQTLLRSGLDITSAGELWLQKLNAIPKRRFVDALGSHATAAEVLGLLGSLLNQLRDEQRFALIADIERRDQLVWIPVSIAVLVPGMIFITIPLEATLHKLLG